jgi:hypothetical protein
MPEPPPGDSPSARLRSRPQVAVGLPQNERWAPPCSAGADEGRAWSPRSAADEAAHDAAHASWLSSRPAWVRALDAAVLTPWWRAHRLRARPDGNSLDAAWRPRAGFAAAAALCAAALALLLAACWLLVLAALPPGAAALAAARLPPAAAALRAGLRGGAAAAALLQSPAALAVALAALFCNGAFAFTSLVTAARRGAWRGLHGDFRDIAVVNAVGVPWLAAVALRPMAGALFFGETAATAPPAADGALARAWALASLGGALEPAAFFVAGAAIGLNVCYAVRAGCCSASISSHDVARANCAQRVGVAARLAIIAGGAALHVSWLLSAAGGGAAAAAPRLAAYAAAVAGLAAVARAVADRYYFHWHHWAAALMLAPLAHTASPALSAALQGLLLAQHVDGACRFSCAPLFHRRPGCSVADGYE